MRFLPALKSKRGVVIFNQFGLIGVGYNSPPSPFKCNGSEACRNSCNKVAVHVEQAALLDALEQEDLTEENRVDGASMLHVKVIDGKAVPSGEPSCWQCSRLILASGIKTMWLLHEDGLKAYTAKEFHMKTLEHCNLPAVEE